MTKFLNLLLDACHKYGDTVAIIDHSGERQTTYRELYNKALRVASYIKRIRNSAPSYSSTEPVECIAIAMPKSMEYYAAEIGCWIAGCAVVPMGDNFPQQRIDYIISHCDARLCIDTEMMTAIENSATETDSQIIDPNIPVPLAPELCEDLDEQALVAIYYTSGSTGNPKGVMHTHASFNAAVRTHTFSWDLKPGDIVGLGSPMYFIASIHDFTFLCNGATLHVFPPNTRNDVRELQEYIEKRNIEKTFMSPTMVAQYKKTRGNLRLVITGSDRVSGVKPEGFILRNLYGQTESAVMGTYFDIDKAYDNAPIGRPDPGIEVSLQDEEGNIVPDGEEGEICLRGILSPGYYKDEERTKQLWRGSWLHTGDIGKMLPDGILQYVNRKDWMVKINGQRVEPGEVETVMKRCPGVKNAIVKGFQNKKGGNYICGYYIPEDGSDITETELEKFMRQYLTDYMIPTCFQRMDSFPLNSNGKLDRKSLKSPLETERGQKDYVMSEAEEEVKDIVSNILGTSDFTINDNLSFVGLTSILATKLASAIYKKYNVQVDVRKLVKSDTVKTLTDEIGNNQKSAVDEDMKVFTHGPLTASQTGIYVECMSNPESLSYNIPFSVALPSGISVEAIEDALRQFVKVHPYVNTCFVSNEDGETYQKPVPDATVDIQVKEISEGELEAEKKSFVRPFDLSNGPLYRFEIVKVSPLHSPLSTLHLLFDFHHLIFDGGSVDIFLSQLCTLLNGGTIENEYYDYYHFANEQQIDSKAEKFFDEQLSQIEESSALLPDVYSAFESKAGEVTVNTNIASCQRKCQELNITPAAFYLAATMITVSKYVAEETVGICTISNGRSNSRIAEDVGMFVNTLPVTSTAKGDMGVNDYLVQTAETFAQTIANEQYPFTYISKKHDYSDNIMFAYQVGLINKYETANGVLMPQPIDTGDVQRPLTILIFGGDEPGKGQVQLTFNRSLFTEGMMHAFATSISKVAQELIHRQKISEIEISDKTQISLLDTFNNPVSLTAEEQNATVVSMFKKMAEHYPDNIAVVFRDKRITYKELDEQTDRIAAMVSSKVLALDFCSVGKSGCSGEHSSEARFQSFKEVNEPIVSIIIHRNEWMVLASLAALKAGCAYQPLDPSYPQERLNFMVKDADAALLIADPDLRPLINEYDGEVLLTEELENLEKPGGIEDLKRLDKITPDSLLTLLYTSGSTGVPKGVMIEHRNLIAFNKFFKRCYEITPKSQVAAYASFGFDANMQDIYCTLMNGATLHIIDEDIRLDMEALHNYFEREGITNSFMTTQVGVQYLELFPQSSSLKHLIMGGEKLRAVKPEELSYKIHNGYGPSETTCGCAFFNIKHWEPNIPIGTPTDTTSLYIIDKYGHRLPVGAPGELWISGPQVGRGYLNRADKTAESFTQNPFGENRVYHSGDIVRYREDGNIEFVGRKDGQVKIRGFRVELKEVEAVILEMPEVKDVTVQAFDNPQGGKFIAAYIVMNASCLFNADNISDFIRDRKPPYMVPTSIMELEKIPLTVNQKVDKKALPTPVMRQSCHDFVAPADELEITIADAFAKVLGLSDKVSVTDSFSDLGGDSIKAIRLLTALRQKNITLLINQILQAGTVRNLAEIARKSSTEDNKIPEYSQESFTGIVEDTPLLEHFRNMHFPKPEHFNQAFLLKADHKIDIEILQKALRDVVDHHDMLKGSLKGGHIFIKDIPNFDFEELNVSASDITDKCDRIQGSIDLENGPWMKCAVLHLTPDAQHPEALDYLFLAIHHLAVDGVSWRIIVEDLNTAYAQSSDKKDISLPKKTASYDAWAKALGELRKTETLKRQKHYWHGVQERRSKCQLSWSKEKGYEQKTIGLTLDSNISKQLLTTSKKAYNTQPNDLFLSALALAWSRLSGNHSIAIQMEGHGREQFNSEILIDRTVGWFTSIYPVVLDNITEDIRHTILTTKQTLRHIPQKGFAYPQLMGIDIEDTGLFTFNFLGSVAEQNDDIVFSICQDYNVGSFIAPENKYGTDIVINSFHTLEGTLIFMLDYNCCRFEDEEMQEFGSMFIESLKKIVEHTLSIHETIKTVDDLGETEWTQDEFDDISTDYMLHGENILSIHTLNESQINEVHNFILNPDIITNSVSPVFMLKELGDKNVCEDIMNILFRKEEYLRSTIAIYGVSVPRRIVSDKKPNLLWYDFSEEHLSDKEQMQKVNDINDLLQHFPYLPQDESPLRIALIKFAEDTQYLICCFHTLLLDVNEARNILIDLFRLVYDATGDMEADALIELLEEAIQNDKDNENDNQSASRPILRQAQHRLSRSTSASEDVHIYSEHPGKKKLFFFHTANTGSEAYFNLAKRISDHCSFYAFEQYNLNHMDAPIDGGIPEIAAKYIEILRTYQPHGPYLLGGWCYGGLMAYEMAHQLVRQGEQVEHIIMLDSQLMDKQELQDPLHEEFIKHSRQYLSTSELFAGIRSKGLLEPLIRNSIRTSWNNIHYQAQPYRESAVTYFKATRKPQGLVSLTSQMYDYLLSERAGGFEKLIPKEMLSVFNIDEEHDSMMSQTALEIIVPEIIKILK